MLRVHWISWFRPLGPRVLVARNSSTRRPNILCSLPSPVFDSCSSSPSFDSSYRRAESVGDQEISSAAGPNPVSTKELEHLRMESLRFTVSPNLPPGRESLRSTASPDLPFGHKSLRCMTSPPRECGPPPGSELLPTARPSRASSRIGSWRDYERETKEGR